MSSNCWSLGFVLRGHFIKAVGNIVSSGIDCRWVSQGSARGVSALPDGRLTSWPLFLEPLHLQVSFGPFPSCVWCALSGWKHYWIPCWATAVSQRFHFPVWDSGHAHTGTPSFYFLLPLAFSPPSCLFYVLYPKHFTHRSSLCSWLSPTLGRQSPQSTHQPLPSSGIMHKCLSNFQCC